MHLKVIVCGGKGALGARAWGRNQRLAVADVGMKFWFPLNAGSFRTTECLIKKDSALRSSVDVIQNTLGLSVYTFQRLLNLKGY